MDFEGVGARVRGGFVLEEVEFEGDVPAADIGEGTNLVIEEQVLVVFVEFDGSWQGERIVEGFGSIREVPAGEELFPECAGQRYLATVAFERRT